MFLDAFGLVNPSPSGERMRSDLCAEDWIALELGGARVLWTPWCSIDFILSSLGFRFIPDSVTHRLRPSAVFSCTWAVWSWSA
jgi:hypothetical protein